MNDDKLGRLEKVDLRAAWKDEGQHFTPWLAQEENLQLLGDTLGRPLELMKQEKEVGPFRADILCKDRSDDTWVLIENQLERTDHTHLGQILTYAAGLEAVTVVWIAKRFTEEHRAALDWLNEHTDEQISFLGLEVELWRIGDSPIAPKFNIVAKPNDWAREVRAGAERAGMTEHRRMQLEFWTAFRDYMAEKSEMRGSTPRPRHWMNFVAGRSGFSFDTIATLWDTETKSENPHTRVELYISGQDAKAYFAQLEKDKTAIEREVGQPLSWYSSENVQSCRVYVKKQANLLDTEEWPKMREWLRKNLELFNKVFGPRVKALDVKQA